MKVNLLAFVLALLTFFTACKKQEFVSVNPGSERVADGPDIQNSNIDIFLDRVFKKVVTGEEVHLSSNRLTTEAINRGITIWVSKAASPDWDYSFAYPPAIDSVELAYKIEPGHVYIISKSPDPITFAIDVSIEYN